MAKKRPTRRKTRRPLPAVKVRDFKEIQRALSRVVGSVANSENEAALLMRFMEDLYLIGYGTGAWDSRTQYDEGWRPRKRKMPAPEEIREAIYDLEWGIAAISRHVPKSALN